MASQEWWNSVISRDIPITRTELRDYLRVMEKTDNAPYSAHVVCKPAQWKGFLDAWIKTIYRGGDVLPTTQFLGAGISDLEIRQLVKYLYLEAGKKYNRKVTFGDAPPPNPEYLIDQKYKEQLKDDQRRLLHMYQQEMLKKQPKLMDLINDPFLQDIIGQKKIGPGYQKTEIKAPPPPPETVIIQFIGGPKNGEQEYYHWADHPYIQQGNVYMVKLEAPIPVFDGDNLIAPSPDPNEIASYRLTFIPMAETPFSDAQIVIGIFQ